LKGIQGEEFLEAEANELIKQSFSWETASQEEINKRNISVAVTRFQKKKGDTGSTPVQSNLFFLKNIIVAILTEKIAYLTKHLQKNNKDHQSRKNLFRFLYQRKSLMKYLFRKYPKEYYETLKELSKRKYKYLFFKELKLVWQVQWFQKKVLVPENKDSSNAMDFLDFVFSDFISSHEFLRLFFFIKVSFSLSTWSKFVGS
jgi:small subunit ribosomal protein S15